MTRHSHQSEKVINLLRRTERDSALWTMDGISETKGKILSFLNAHAVAVASNNDGFYNSLMHSDYVLRDGIGVKIAMKIFGLNPSENLNGTDLITKIIPLLKNRKIAIFGASIEALTAAKDKLEKDGIDNIIDVQHGFHPFEFYHEMTTLKKPDVIILCMGMPRQELLAVELLKDNPEAFIICGGGWADFYSGVKKRAPEWVRKISMEWVHRLCSEPKRLGKRYSIEVVYFFYLILKAKFLNGEK